MSKKHYRKTLLVLVCSWVCLLWAQPLLSFSAECTAQRYYDNRTVATQSAHTEPIEAIAPIVAPSTFLQDVIDTATSYVGTRERGTSNRSSKVDFFNRTAGAPLGSAWCMSFVYSVFNQVAKARKETNPLKRTGAVWRQLAHARSFGNDLEIIYLGNNFAHVAAEAGDIGIMSNRGTTKSLIGSSWYGHTFIVSTDSEASQPLKTIEGNTNRAGSRNGVAVMQRERSSRSVLALIRYGKGNNQSIIA